MAPNNNHLLRESSELPDIKYPCTWSYTVIGEDCSLLKDTIVSACTPLPVRISHSHSSSKGKYYSLHAELEVPNEKARLRIYATLKESLSVKIIL